MKETEYMNFMRNRKAIVIHGDQSREHCTLYIHQSSDGKVMLQIERDSPCFNHRYSEQISLSQEELAKVIKNLLVHIK